MRSLYPEREPKQVNDLGEAIYCNCFIPEYGRHKILGSITSEGVLEILRGHKNKTIISMTNFVIYCPVCGFSKSFSLKKHE